MADFTTNVKLYKGVPLDVTNANQLTFDSLSAQSAFFASKPFLNFDGYFYQRKDRYIAVEANADSIQDYNYVSFKNPQYGLDKTFYCFITAIEYVGEKTSNVYFQLDNWQTYQFDIDIKECYVEREHVTSDSIGENLEEEGFALGDYVTRRIESLYFDNFWIVMGVTVDIRQINQLPPLGGYVYGGIYSGVSYFCFDTTTSAINMMEIIIQHLADEGKSDAIVTLFMLPKQVVSVNQDEGAFLQAEVRPPVQIRVPETQAYGNYTPRNNKLLTYPYRSLVISNNEGNASILRYEYFDSASRFVEYQGGLQMNSKVILYPKNYKGVKRNFDESIALGNFPQCCWSKDLYSNWLASQSVRWGYQQDRMLMGNIAGAGQMVVSTIASSANILQGGLAGGVAQAANYAINVEQNNYNMQSSMSEEKEVHSMIPNSIQGSVGNGYTNISIDAYCFVLQERTISVQKAKLIDKFFDMRGYAVKAVKKPNIKGRRSWNYVKTVGCNIFGNIPNYALQDIKGLFDRGITFWHGDFVGDYSRDNTIGGVVTPSQFRLTIINGSGGGSFAPNAVIPISANDTGGTFLAWESTGGTFENRFTNPTNFTMPSENVTVSWVETGALPSTIADLMMKDIGAVEWDAVVGKIQTWYYGSYVKAAWCTTAISYYANEMGLIPNAWKKNENVDSAWRDVYAMYPELCWRTANYGGADKMPKRGDIIFFSSVHTTADLTHVGCVTSVSGTSISYVSGNTSNPSGGNDGIFEKTLSITNNYVVCFYALPYGAG